MRLLFMAQRVPYPPNRGDKIATYHQVRYLARKHEVDVVCLAEDKDDLNNVPSLSPIVSSVDAVPLSPRRAMIRAVSGLASGASLTVRYFNEPALHKRVAARVAARRYEAAIVYSSGMAQFVERYTNIPRIMIFGDLDSLKWGQYAGKSSPPMKWVYRRECRRLLEYERRIATTFSHSVVHTQRELEDFQRLIPGAPVTCVRNGVDLDFFQSMDMPKKANSLVFTGVMDYFPNVEGVMWFCREVLPLIRREIPDVSFVICGARPNAVVQRMGKLPGVVVTGHVNDVRPYMARSSLGVVPLRIARGIQNKILEAMAMGLPVVSTTAAYLGIEAIDGRDLLTAEEPAQFAAAVIGLLKDGDRRRDMGRAARKFVESNYAWHKQLSRLDRILESVAEPMFRRCEDNTSPSGS